MTDRIEQILLSHERAVVGAGQTYDGQVSSGIRKITKQAIHALISTEIAKARIEGKRVMYNELWKLAIENPPEEGIIKILKRLGDMHDEIMAEGKKALAEVESNKEGVEVNE